MALRRLATVALVVVLATAALYTANLTQTQSFSIPGNDPSSMLSAWFRFNGYPLMLDLATGLVYGAVTVGMVVAWASHRTRWLVAMLLVTLTAIIWPRAFEFWQYTHPQGDAAPSMQFQTVAILLLISQFAIMVVSVALALVFALKHSTRSNAATVDAEMGIIRSAL
ncbi:MAG TPA: hypothetical protein VF812_12960 [Ktedonobacterales bacterium]